MVKCQKLDMILKKISLIGAGNIGTILAFSISRRKLGDILLVDVVDGLAKGKCTRF